MIIFSQLKIRSLWDSLQEKLRRVAAPHLVTAKGRWQSLNRREKCTVLAGTILTSMLLFYLLIWSPLNTHLTELRGQILQEKKTAAWMQAADSALRKVESKQTKLTAKLLSQRINLIQEDLRQAPLHQNLTQLTQSSADEIRCVFDRVDFDTFIRWLMEFSQQHNLTIKQATVRRLNNVGLVQAELIFQVKQ